MSSLVIEGMRQPFLARCVLDCICQFRERRQPLPLMLAGWRFVTLAFRSVGGLQACSSSYPHVKASVAFDAMTLLLPRKLCNLLRGDDSARRALSTRAKPLPRCR